MTTAKKVTKKKSASLQLTRKRKMAQAIAAPRLSKVIRTEKRARAPAIGMALGAALADQDIFEFKPKHELTPGFMIREIREQQGLTQGALAELAGLTQAAISALENDEQTLGLDRAKALARALKVHPSVLAFPAWDIEKESATRGDA